MVRPRRQPVTGSVRLGFAVKVLGDGGLPSHDTRRWQSGPHLRWSLEALHGVIGYCERNGIRMYRMTAALAPYATHPDMPQFHRQVDECRDELAAFGERLRAADIRLSTHPSQYIVLNSEDPAIRAAAARDVELQADLLDAMGAGPEAVCVLHVGGATGGFDAGLERFERGLETLSDRARDRLVIENDDRTFALSPRAWSCTGARASRWSGTSSTTTATTRTGSRTARRSSSRSARGRAGVVPKIHYSTPKTAMEERKRRVGRRVERSWVLPQLRAHADMIDPIGFEHFLRETAAGLELDVMLEAKAKDLALLRLREQLAARGLHPEGQTSAA